MAFIYKVTNTINGKMYIGQTKRTIDTRWKQHVHSSITDNPFDKGPLHRAIKKYGPEAFVVEEVEECSEENLNDRETYWIKHFGTFGNGYNATLGGDHPVSYESDKILALWNEGFSISEIATKLGIAQRTVSDRLRCNGIKKDETITRGMKKSGKTKRLPVYMYDRDGNYVAERKR